jgi:hypothetical protein
MFSTKVNDKSPLGVNASADRKSEKSSPYMKNQNKDHLGQPQETAQPSKGP